MSGFGRNDLLYNLAAESGPHRFYRMAGEYLQLCASGQRVWVQAGGRWFFWQLGGSEGSADAPKSENWNFVGEVQVCYGRQPVRPS